MALDEPLIIVGGGLAGSLAALALARAQPDLPVLLLEAGCHFGGNHTWSFFDSDVPPASTALVGELEPVRWRRHAVRFPGRSHTYDTAYSAVGSAALDRLVRTTLNQGNWRTNTAVTQVEAGAVVLESGERIAARGVIDARGPDGPMPGLVLGWQKFVGLELAASAPDPDCATVMDATVEQIDGYRFVYVLPLAADRLLIEDTYYSNTPDLDVALVAQRAHRLAAARGFDGPEIRRETGILPILIGGDPDRFWPADDAVARLGLRGGFFHATTGYSFSLALQLAQELAALGGEYRGPQLAAWSRQRFLRHWHSSRFFRMLNTMLFRAAAPAERYRVFEHFYRLPPDLVARFYAGKPRLTDKLRILSGKPPVAIGAAVRALLGRTVR